MIRVLLEMNLVHPYGQSLSVLSDFCSLYKSIILFAGTYRRLCSMSMPVEHFKKIFKCNPIIKEYPVPSGMENFVESIKVVRIIAK